MSKIAKKKKDRLLAGVGVGLLVAGAAVGAGYGINALVKHYKDKPPVEQGEEQNEVEATNLPPEAAFYYNLNIE